MNWLTARVGGWYGWIQPVFIYLCHANCAYIPGIFLIYLFLINSFPSSWGEYPCRDAHRIYRYRLHWELYILFLFLGALLVVDLTSFSVLRNVISLSFEGLSPLPWLVIYLMFSLSYTCHRICRVIDKSLTSQWHVNDSVMWQITDLYWQVTDLYDKSLTCIDKS